MVTKTLLRKLLWQWSVAMLSIMAYLKQFHERFSAYTHLNLHRFNMFWVIMIEEKLIPRFRSLWCHQRPGKLTTALELRPRAVVSFPGRWWHHNDLNLGINSYDSSLALPVTWNYMSIHFFLPTLTYWTLTCITRPQCVSYSWYVSRYVKKDSPQHDSHANNCLNPLRPDDT